MVNNVQDTEQHTVEDNGPLFDNGPRKKAKRMANRQIACAKAFSESIQALAMQTDTYRDLMQTWSPVLCRGSFTLAYDHMASQ